MNDKKSPHSNPSQPGSDPGLSPDADENPWDDDGGGRTLATEGPSFELPSNIPSPITVPPPAMQQPPPKRKPAATMIGFGPPGPALPGAPTPATFGSPPAPAAPAAPVAPAAPAARKPSAISTANLPFPVMPLGGGTVQGSPAPPSSPDLSAAAAAAHPPPSAGKRPPPMPPRPAGAPPSGNAPGAPRPRPPAVSSTSMMDAPPRALPSSSPPPPALDDHWPAAEQREDGPTMAVSSPALTGRPLRDDVANPRAAGRAASPMASTGYAPQGMGGLVDKDADTIARLDTDDDMVPGESEEATRAVSREELMRHQDAHVVAHADAIGDEATLALAPGQVDLGIRTGLAAALAESITREGSQSHMQSAPAFPGFPEPPQHFQNNPPMGSSGHLAAAQPYGQHGGMGMGQPPPSWQGEAPSWQAEAPQWQGEAPQSYRNPPMGGSQPMGMQPGYDPMLPQGPQSNPNPSPSMQGYPQSGAHAATGPGMGPGGYAQGGMSGGFGPNASSPTAQQQSMGGGQAGMQGGPQNWMAPQGQGPQALQAGAAPSKLTPQVILLVAVGAVCLAIFIIGIVLFVTTKF